MDLSEFISKEIENSTRKLSDASTKNDELAKAKVAYFESLSCVLNKKATMADVGTMDAINDTLQELGLVAAGRTFYQT